MPFSFAHSLRSCLGSCTTAGSGGPEDDAIHWPKLSKEVLTEEVARADEIVASLALLIGLRGFTVDKASGFSARRFLLYTDRGCRLEDYLGADAFSLIVR